MYANVKDVYSATPLPALGKAGHNLILLKPHNISRMMRVPSAICSFRTWSPDAEQTVTDCFRSMGWDALQGSHKQNMEMFDCTVYECCFSSKNLYAALSITSPR